MRSRRLAAVAVLCGLALSGRLCGEEVSRTPPAIYAEKLAPLLTPLDEVLATKDAFTAADGTGAVLLDEEIDYVDEEGRRYNVEHLVYRALTEEGCKVLGKETHSFRRSDQKIFLVLARTILPDGRKIPIQPNAAFLKSPQYEAGKALYDDGGELILVFPNVDVGAITESIVVTEQAATRIPGEYTRMFAWRSGWPEMKCRRVIDLPESLAGRLKITPQGEDVPEPVRESPAAGRTRLSWTTGREPAGPWEGGMPPSSHSGPSTWLTTMAGWDVFARWYAGLLEGRAKLDPALAAQVDEWTKDAKTPREIINILTERVSRDVRYTGLEFGLAGFQPEDCNLVWANRYGDCKDKANLLRAMLAHKGVASRLALLDTEHAGRIEKRSPDYRQFDHMILAVEPAPGEWLFCDPTISYGHAGLIAPSDADRDVLLIGGGGDEYLWARTPPAEAGRLSYHFDLARDAQGETSGWVAFRAEGYYAAGYISAYTGKDREDMLRAVGERLRDFFPAAEVVDIEKLPAAAEGGAFEYKAFFVIPTDSHDQSGTSTVALPFYEGLLPDIGPDNARKTAFFQWRDLVEVKLKLALPQGVTAVNVPAPYQVTSPSFVAGAGWSAGEGKVEGFLSMQTKESLIPPAGFPVFKNAVRSLRSWLDRPLMLGAAGDGGAATAQAAKTPEEVSLENFPMMPTADGQRTLLDKRFPPDGSASLRRKALNKIVQYFPNDKETQFYAGMNLAFLNVADGKQSEAIKAIASLIETYRSSIETSWVLWGEYRLALLYLDAKEPEKARPLFVHLAKDETTSDFRKAWSAYYAADLLSSSSPDESLALLQAGVTLDTEALSKQLPLLARLALKKGQPAMLRDSLGKVAARKTTHSENAILQLIESSGALPKDKGEELLALVEESGISADEEAGEALKKARAKSQWKSVWKTLQAKLKDYLAKHPLSEKSAPADTSREEIQKEIDKAVEGKLPERSLALTLDLLTRFEPDDEYPELLWRSATRAEWKEKISGSGTAGPLLPFLLDLCEGIPRDNDFYFEGRVVRGRVLSRAGDQVGAEAVFASLLVDPEFPPAFEITVREDLGKTQEKQGKYEAALKNYLELQKRIGEHSSISDVMLRAVLIQLHLGRQDDAILLLQQLDKADAAIAAKAEYSYQIGGMTRLARQPESANAYWESTRQWEEEARRLSARLAPGGSAPEPVVVPAIGNLSELGGEMGEAVRGRDTATFTKDWNLLVSSARWDPGMALELVSMRESAASLYPDLRGELTRFVTAVLEPIPTGDGDLRRRDIMLATTFLDAEQPEKALEVAQRFLKDDQQDELNFTMRRIQGVAAYNAPKERAAAITALEQCLDLPDATTGRIYAVRILARLYSLEGRSEDEEKLLQRELEHPRIKAAEQYGELQERHRALSQGGSVDRDFSLFIKEWLPKHKPAWYDYAEPASLEDHRLGDLAAVLAAPDSYFSPLEVIKMQLLVSQDTAQPYLVRVNAWDSACMRLLNLLPLQSEVDKFFSTILENKLLAEEVKRRWLWFAVYEAGTRYQEPRFTAYLKNPLAKGFTPQQRQGAEAFAATVSTDITSIASIEKTFDLLGAKPVGLAGVEQVGALFSAALRLGELDAAQRMYDRFAKFTFSQDVTQTSATIAFELLKQIKLARRWAPVQQALRDAVLKRFPAADIKRPDNYDELRHLQNPELLRVPNGTAIRLYRILNRQIEPNDLMFWSSFAQGLKQSSAAGLRLDLAEIMIAQAPDDQIKAAAVAVAAGFTDLDDEKERARLCGLYQAYGDAAKWPITTKASRFLDASIAERTGQGARFEELVAGIERANGAKEAQWMRANYFLVQGDVVRLKEAFASMNSAEFLTREKVNTAIEALEMAGMADEALLAREAGRKELYRLILESWAEPTKASLRRSFDLADTLGDPKLVPEGWLEDLSRTIQDEFTRLTVLIDIARLRKDWKQVDALAAQAMEKFPTFYHFYWLRAEALYSLGKKQEALAPLKVYAAYAKDERHYRKAMEWIEGLEGVDSARR